MDIYSILADAANMHSVSDVFIVAGRPLAVRRSGIVQDVGEEKIVPHETHSLIEKLYRLADREFSKLEGARDDDFSVSIPGVARFRVNTYFQRGSVAAVIRVVKFSLPEPSEIHIPDEVMGVAKLTSGLVLVTGPAGSGKSTTLACLIDAINTNRRAHIVTIEDPIEYLHRNKLSIVSQREVSIDTHSYIRALRASLRESPDVILVGEMRDLETMRAAITAAETGHLVFSTLHTLGAANTIDRIVDVFPPDQQQQIRVELAQVLKSVVSQKLVHGEDHGVVPVFEIMHVNNAIKTMIRENRIHQIDAAIQTGRSNGMFSLDDYLLKLVTAKCISSEVALENCFNVEQLRKRLG